MLLLASGMPLLHVLLLLLMLLLLLLAPFLPLLRVL